MTTHPMSGGVVAGVEFDRWAVVLVKPDAVERGKAGEVLERIADAGVEVLARTDLVAQAWQAHVVYRDLLARSGHTVPDLPARLDAEFAGRTVTVALAHGEPGIHEQLQRLIGHTDPTRAAAGTIRGDLGNDTLTAADATGRLVRNLVHTSNGPDAARRDFGTWFRPQPTAFDPACSSVVLCKPDAATRGLTDAVLARIAAANCTVTDRRDLIVQPWQAHVHYWDLLVDADHFPDRDIPACLDEAFAGRRVTVALAHGEPGVHGRLRDLLGYFDPARAAAGTIRGDLGNDTLTAALAERRLVRNLVHTSDDPEAARRDFGTWYGAARAGLLVPPQRTTI